jgi:hypothetical protein
MHYQPAPPQGPSSLHDVWRLPRPPPGAPAADRNSGMMLHFCPAPRHHGVAPPLHAQGTQFFSFWSKNSEVALVIWMSI